jgi:hypothetical protein
MEFAMKKLVTLSIVSALALGAAACSKTETTENATANANEAVVTEGNFADDVVDANATADNVAIENAVASANAAGAELNNAATANSSNSH